MYGIYKDSDLTILISQENNLTSPDTESDLNGDDGETAVKALFCAVIQSQLAAAITDTEETEIEVDNAYFRFTDLSVIKIGDELMYVTGGLSPAGTTLTVIRGWNSTTKATHLIDARVYMAYNVENVAVVCRDNEQVVTGDESSYVTYCLDDGEGEPDGSYSAELSLGDIDYDESVAFHRKVIIPESSDAESKQDLIHDLKGPSGASFKLIPLDS